MKNLQVLKPYYRTAEILEHIRECCETSWTGMGGKTLDFEKKWMAYSNAKTCHMLNSATSGLHLAILQLKEKYKWDDDSEIITTPITFVSTNHAILYNNLKPVFADIDTYGCLCPDSVIDKINSKTKAIMFVGLGGNVGSLISIMEIAKKYNLSLILDAAHMSGTKWWDNNIQVGNNAEIEVTIFSGQAVKNLPTCDSGWICWNGDDAVEMDKQSRELSWLGINKDTFSRSSSEGTYKWYYDVPQLGYKFHSNAVTASFALVGLDYLDKDNAYRRQLCDTYTNFLNDDVTIVPESGAARSSRHLFQILVPERDKVILALNQCGIYPGVHYRDNTLYSMYNYAQGTCPYAEEFSNNTLTLPLNLHITETDIEFICSTLISILRT